MSLKWEIMDQTLPTIYNIQSRDKAEAKYEVHVWRGINKNFAGKLQLADVLLFSMTK